MLAAESHPKTVPVGIACRIRRSMSANQLGGALHPKPVRFAAESAEACETGMCLRGCERAAAVQWLTPVVALHGG
jgi:hypothetical protein